METFALTRDEQQLLYDILEDYIPQLVEEGESGLADEVRALQQRLEH